MADRRIAWPLALLIAVIGLAMVLTRGAGGSSTLPPGSPVALPHAALGSHPVVAPFATPSPALGRSGLPHDRPPDPAQLRDYRQAQAVYDAEAKPGDFVTPPSVSVAH